MVLNHGISDDNERGDLNLIKSACIIGRLFFPSWQPHKVQTATRRHSRFHVWITQCVAVGRGFNQEYGEASTASFWILELDQTKTRSEGIKTRPSILVAPTVPHRRFGLQVIAYSLANKPKRTETSSKVFIAGLKMADDHRSYSVDCMQHCRLISSDRVTAVSNLTNLARLVATMNGGCALAVYRVLSMVDSTEYFCTNSWGGWCKPQQYITNKARETPQEA